MSTPQERYVQAGDYRVRVLEAGRGDPLLFLHSAIGAGVWTDGIARLSQRFRVLLPDHPGFGPSPLPDWLVTMEDMVFHYLDLLDELNITNPLRVIGSSFGGWIAAEFTAAHPERVQKLVLVDAAGLRIPAVPIPDVFRLPPQEVLPLAFHDMSKAMAIMPKDFGPDSLVQMFHDRSAFARLAWNPYLHNPKLPRRLKRATVPALVVWGQQDRLIPPVYAEEYKRLLPTAEVAYIDQCGHDPTIEQPEEFARVAVEFLR